MKKSQDVSTPCDSMLVQLQSVLRCDFVHEQHALMAGQLNGNVIQSKDAALAVLTGPDGTDLAGRTQLVCALVIRAHDASK